MSLMPAIGRSRYSERIRATGRVAAIWAAIALTVALPAQAAASDEGSAAQAPGEGFSSAAEFVDAQWAGEHYAAIDALASQGVFDGTACGAARFCLDAPVPRWVMAVWLVRFLDREEPGTVGGTRFADVGAAQWWAGHVERLADLGITAGCAAGEFCPHRPVTRGQTASFLSRALDLEAADGSGFEDVGSESVHAPNIGAVTAAGVMDGCEPGRFCPDETVTRSEMASLLNKSRNWLPAEYARHPLSTARYTPVEIPDDNLRAIVERAIGKAPGSRIVRPDVQELITLNAGYSDIGDLTGLEHFIRLRTLNLSNNLISDLAPLAGLTELRSLDLGQNSVTDAAPLEGLTRLETLSLVNSGLTDAAPLAALTRLKHLNLYGNHLKDAAPLAALTNLETLDLAFSDIGRVAPLGALTRLRVLNLEGNFPGDISPLAALTGLRTLNVRDNLRAPGSNPLDFSPLAALTGLQTLMLDETSVPDLSPLSALTGLRALTLNEAGVSDASPLAGLTSLELLWLGVNEIADTAPLASLTGLRELDLADNAVSDVSPLAGLFQLRRLTLASNEIEDYTPLCGLVLVVQPSWGCDRAETTTGDFAGTIRLGAALSETGRFSVEGRGSRQGYDTWLRWVNEVYGGIRVGGQRYRAEIVYYDDESDADTANRLTQRLIDDGVDFLLGPYSSSLTSGTSAIAEANNVLMVEGIATADTMFERGFQNLFLVATVASDYTRSGIEALAARGANTAVIAYKDDPFIAALADGAARHLEASGIDLLAVETYPEDTQDMSAIMTKFRNLDPDLFVGGGHYNDAVVFVNSAKESGFEPAAMLITVGPTNPELIAELGSDVDGVLGPTQWESSMAYRGPYFGSAADYADYYQSLWGEPPVYQAASSTAAALALHLAIEAAGSTDTEAVRGALRALSVDTFYGPISFDHRGVNTSKPMGTVQVQDGKIVVVAPDAAATAELQYPRASAGRSRG